jgi:hypothetical protein
MKGRQLNKLYQMMRVARFFEMHKEKIIAPALKRSLKGFNDLLDNMLVSALEQKTDITFAAREKAEKREEMVRATLQVASLAGIYYLQTKNIQKQIAIGQPYTYYKMVSEVSVATRCQSLIRTVEEDIEFLKPYGLSRKDLQNVNALASAYEKLKNRPRNLLSGRIARTFHIKQELKELDVIQKKTLDGIAKCFFNKGILKSEYARVRKIIHHKNPEGLFDEMIKRYRGATKKKPLQVNSVLKSKTATLKNELPGYQASIMSH